MTFARVRQWIRYGTVSVISTTISLTVLGLLVSTNTLSAGWANIVATAIGTVPSFELNRAWVWGKAGKRSVRDELVPFWALSFAGLALSTLAVSATAAWASAAGVSHGWRTLLVELANVAAFGSLWLVQFALLDRLLFAHSDQTPARPQALSNF